MIYDVISDSNKFNEKKSPEKIEKYSLEKMFLRLKNQNSLFFHFIPDWC